MDKAKLLARLLATFVDELDEHVRTLNEELLVLEKNAVDEVGAELLSKLFRSVHSLKGASRAVDLPEIEQVCHHMEDLFTSIRDKRLQPTPKICSVMFEAVDAIASAGKQLREKEPVDASLLGTTVARLVDVQAGGDVAASPQPASEVTPSLKPAAASPSIAAAATPQEPAEQPAPGSQGAKTAPARVTSSEPSTGRTLPGSIRVAERKLDSLLAQSGELLVARQRVEARPAEMESLLESVSVWRREWQEVVGTLRQLVQQGGRNRGRQRSKRMRERVSQTIEQSGDRFAQLEDRLAQLTTTLTRDASQLTQASRALQGEILGVRMLPFAEACAGLERAVRDVCRTTGKEVSLLIEGGDIEVDRAVLEALSDPLLHLVRNAIDHGIEAPAQRILRRKPVPAVLKVSAAVRGAEVEVTVSDDGQGLNLERIRERLRSQGLEEPGDDRDVARCILLPGFSTAATVTDVSGRGVGMDVVKSHLESLRGRIDIAFEPGLGTQFTLCVPLSLTMVSALFVRCGEQTYAFPTSTVSKLVRFESTSLHWQQGETVLPLGSIPIRVVALAEVLNLPGETTSPSTQIAVQATVGAREMLIVVDEVLAEQEAVVKTLGRRIRSAPHVSGAITLRSGELALLLNTATLIQSVEQGLAVSFASGRVEQSVSDSDVGEKTRTGRILVVDDSLTTRTLLKSILETAGYEVTAASDGQEAWDQLQTNEIDVVVSDVDMPLLNGFELTEKIRNSPDRGQLPVILVTSRDSDTDKRRGVEVGADAYLVKSSFDQTSILATIEQFL